MTKGHDNRQQVLFECFAVAFFLLSQNKPTKHSSAVETSAPQGQTPEPVAGQITRRQPAAANSDGGGWLTPALGLQRWQDAQLFQLAGKVAGIGYKHGQQGLDYRLNRAEKFPKVGLGWIKTGAGHRPPAEANTHPIQVVSVPSAGLEPTNKVGFASGTEDLSASDTTLTQRTAESRCATKLDHHSRHDSRPMVKGGGGASVERVQTFRWVRPNAEFRQRGF